MNKHVKTGVVTVIVLILAGIVFSISTATVPTGYTGIITTFGRVSDTTLEAGLHFKNPMSNVVLMDNREQKHSFETVSFSSDIQQVDIKGSVNYNINKLTAMTLFKEVGTGYYDILIMPRLLENIKAVFSKYSAEKLVGEREKLSVLIRDQLKGEMDKYGINIINVSLECRIVKHLGQKHASNLSGKTIAEGA